MTDMNAVHFTGRVVKDASITQYANDLKVANFTVVVNRDRKNGEQWEEKSTFVDLALFGKTAESYLKYLTKGKVIGVEGHLDMDKWEKDGKQFSRLNISIDRIYPFIAGGKKAEGAGISQQEIPQETSYEDFQPVPPDGENAIF